MKAPYRVHAEWFLHAFLSVLLLIVSTAGLTQQIDIGQISTGSQGVNNDVLGFSPSGESVCFESTEIGGARGLRCGPAVVGASHPIAHDILAASDYLSYQRYAADSRFIYYVGSGSGISELYRASLLDYGQYERVSRPSGTVDEVIQQYLLSPQDAVVEWAFGPSPVLEAIDLDNTASFLQINSDAGFAALRIRGWTSNAYDRIIYSGTVGGETRLYGVDIDGTQHATLSFPGAAPSFKAISQSTARVVYTSTAAGAGDDVYTAPITGGSSTRLSASSDTPQIEDLNLSANAENVCYLEFLNLAFSLSCGPVDDPTSMTSSGSVADFDPEWYDQFATYLPMASHEVLGERFVSLVERQSGQTRLLVTPMDGSGVADTWSQGVTHFEVVAPLNAVVYRRSTGTKNPYAWYLREIGSPSPVLLFEEESDSARGFFEGYSGVADRLIFRRDTNPFAANRFEVFVVASDGTQGTYVSGGGLYQGVLSQPGVVLSADQTTLIYAARTFNLVSGSSSTRVRAHDLLSGAAVTLLTRVDPDGAPARQVADIAVHPTDPLGTLILAQSDTLGQGYDFWLTRTRSQLLFSDRFELP